MNGKIMNAVEEVVAKMQFTTLNYWVKKGNIEIFSFEILNDYLNRNNLNKSQFIELEELFLKINKCEKYIYFYYNHLLDRVNVEVTFPLDLNNEEKMNAINRLEYWLTMIECFETSEKQAMEKYLKKMSTLK